MAWTTNNNVPEVTRYGSNFLTFIKTNAADALAWADADNLLPVGMADFAQVFNSSAGRMREEWPSLMLIGERAATDLEDDFPSIAWEVTLEFALVGNDAELLATQARVFGYALASLAANVPKERLFDNAAAGHHVLDSLELDFEQRGPRETLYLSIGQIRLNYNLWIKGYGS